MRPGAAELATSDPECNFTAFASDEFWQPIADAKRKIKILRKKIKSEEKIMRDHLALIHKWYHEAGSDTE